LISRINSILADTTQFAGFTTSRGRETLVDIFGRGREPNNNFRIFDKNNLP